MIDEFHNFDNSSQSSLETWIMEHGAATAFAGCVLFWLVVGLAIYFLPKVL
jgi:hypothetical protein